MAKGAVAKEGVIKKIASVFGNNFIGMKKVNKGKLWKNLFFNKAVGE